MSTIPTLEGDWSKTSFSTENSSEEIPMPIDKLRSHHGKNLFGDCHDTFFLSFNLHIHDHIRFISSMFVCGIMHLCINHFQFIWYSSVASVLPNETLFQRFMWYIEIEKATQHNEMRRDTWSKEDEKKMKK